MLKSQSAMEYLMTYGWAILIIAVVLSILFQLGVFSSGNFQPHAQAGSCQVSSTAAGVSLEGQCNGLLPQYVAQFNGNLDYITAPSTSALSSLGGTNSLSIFAWVYAPYFSSGNERFVGFGPNTGLQFYEAAGSGHSLSMTNCWSNPSSTLVPSLGAWHFIGLVESSGTVTFYLDGQTPQSISLAGGSCNTAGTLYVGSDDGPAGDYFVGHMANLQIYNTSLSQSEASALYLEGIGGAPIRPQNIVGWWPLNGNLNDYSGNANNGAFDGVTFNSSWENSYTAP